MRICQQSKVKPFYSQYPFLTLNPVKVIVIFIQLQMVPFHFQAERFLFDFFWSLLHL